MSCKPIIDPKDIQFSKKSFCFLKDKCGKPMTNPTLEDIIDGLDVLLCEMKNKLADCCSITKHFNICQAGKIRLVSLKRGNTFVASNIYFNSVGALLAYLNQYDTFTYATGIISVTSIFDWQLNVECEPTNCTLDLTIIPPSYQNCN